MKREAIKDLVGQMTLEEKAGMCSGKDFWHLKGVERLGIESVMVSDGPHGLRKQEDGADHLGINESIKAVCFPTGCATAASFDRALIKSMGEVIGNECQAEGISTILGPALNIKRSPLCGRNFEYYSEDPYVSTELAGALVEGVQSKKVGTSMKHFLANNQETKRNTSSSEVDERTMREIYLASFEGAVKKAKPWTMMCSYNRINGTYASENETYLTDILRKEWGFDGYVMSDWGAVNERVAGLKAGLELEMPASGGFTDIEIVEAVKAGESEETVLDTACERILDFIFRFTENRDTKAVFDREKDQEIARRIADECIVLLKNKDNILPLNKEKKVAFIGKYAETPRYQGGGSSHINSSKVEGALDYVKMISDVTYAQGFNEKEDATDALLLQEAVALAKESEVAVIFAGLPDAFESEGYDRTHMQMPMNQNELIEKVCAVQPNTIVVLHNGSPVEMPWIDQAAGVIEAYLGGQAIGGALVNVLYGYANPCGHLPETFPKRLEDTPCFFNYGGYSEEVAYKEGVFVGYRYYASKKMDVLFPFGHGLSYTDFAYSNVIIDKNELKDVETLTVSVDVTNTGEVAGKALVQLYVAPPAGKVVRPVRELKGFEKVALDVGETKTVTFVLDKRAFAYWNTVLHDWHVERGVYTIQFGENAHDMLTEVHVNIESTVRVPKHFTLNSIIGDILEDPMGKVVMEQVLEQIAAASPDPGVGENAIFDQEAMQAMFQQMPLRQLVTFSGGALKETFVGMIEMLNAQ